MNCTKTDNFTFERERLGKSTKYGKYLYRNISTNELIASYDSPYNEKVISPLNDSTHYMLLYDVQPPKQIFTLKKQIFSGSDIGLYADASIYYKNN